MAKQKATNITWHHAHITREDRGTMKGHQGAVLWFTGLSSSGKSTVATAVEAALFERGCHTYVLDGDNIRHGLNKDLGFSPEDRHENIRRIGEVAHLFADAGVIAMTAFISPYAADRQMVREINAKTGFIEVYCECPLDVCEQRDPKGLYKKARAGEIKNFTGVNDPYEPPLKPEAVLKAAELRPEACVAQLLAYLRQHGILKEA